MFEESYEQAENSLVQMEVVQAGIASQRPSIDSLLNWASLPVEYCDSQVSQDSDSLTCQNANPAVISVQFVTEEEMISLNGQFRDKWKPTNILSFPSDIPAQHGINLLGDLAICPSIVMAEAQEQSKPLADHWAHLIIHGVLHLYGYDHIDTAEAEEMEALEVALLAKLEIPDPYQVNEAKL